MKHKYLKDVVTLELERDKCTGCGMCVEICPHNVFNVESRKAFISNKDSCMECGACAKNCPAAAISVQAGVGCASAIIRSKTSGSGDCCC